MRRKQLVPHFNICGRGAYLLRVLKVLEESIFVPCNGLRNVGRGVGVTISLARLAAKDTGWTASAMFVSQVGKACLPVQVGANLVRLTSTESVALSTAGLEETSTLSSVTYTSERVSKRCRRTRQTTYQQSKACLDV